MHRVILIEERGFGFKNYKFTFFLKWYILSANAATHQPLSHRPSRPWLTAKDYRTKVVQYNGFITTVARHGVLGDSE